MSTRLSYRGRVVSFLSGQKRREGQRLLALQQAHEEAREAQIRAAEQLERVLLELERASRRVEETAWNLGVAQQKRVHILSFGTLMNWVTDICRLRNPGEHFCIADLIRSPDEPRAPDAD